MKKFGFTLAEVLITLGIIGVIAAVTLPALMTDTTAAQIGPKLAKAVAMFEQANEALLNNYQVDTLTDAGLVTRRDTLGFADSYGRELSNYLKITRVGNGRFLSKDGMIYTFNEIVLNDSDGSKNIGLVDIDINGDASPNTMGEDRFQFGWDNDGTLKPRGATMWLSDPNADIDGSSHWTTQCPKAEDGPVLNAAFCAGHIFENNLKVLYRF